MFLKIKERFRSILNINESQLLCIIDLSPSSSQPASQQQLLPHKQQKVCFNFLFYLWLFEIAAVIRVSINPTIKVLTHFVNCCYFCSSKEEIHSSSDCSVLNQLSWLLLIVDTQRHERGNSRIIIIVAFLALQPAKIFFFSLKKSRFIFEKFS